jgi:hypothetical protein
MPGIVTHKFRLHNAEQFYEAFSEATDSVMYIFVARTNAWTVDASPPTPTDTTKETNYDIWRNMIAAKRVTSSDISYCTTRTNWANNTFYAKYADNNSTLWSNNFFVVTDTYNVYKVIDNNNNANSTVKPTSTSSATVKTTDGYRWKYMYTITAADALKFLTTNYIPVKTLSANDGSSQWTVQQAAANGALEYVDLTANGTLYLQTNGTIGTVTNSSVVILAVGANTTDNIYNGSAIYIDSGLGAAQVREVVDYNGTTRALTVNNAFTTSPNTSSTYIVSPKVLFDGDGSGASAYSNVSSGQVTDVTMIAQGTNYSFGSVTITANSSHGSGAAASVYTSQWGGHGKDPVLELGGYNVMLNVRLTGTESNTFIVNNDFRVIGLMKDPLLESSGLEANGSVYDMTTKLTLTSISGTYTFDEVLDGGTSSATARVVAFANTNGAGTTGVLSVTGVNAAFTATETVTGNTSSVTATVSSIASRGLKDYHGEVLYIENRPPVSRASDQIEDIKIITKF